MKEEIKNEIEDYIGCWGCLVGIIVILLLLIAIKYLAIKLWS